MLLSPLRRIALAALLAMPLAAAAQAQGQTQPPLIAGASDLQFALAEIAAQFRAETGQEVRLSLGSSGETSAKRLAERAMG
jgi:molybdate transport system substrate-binding protein